MLMHARSAVFVAVVSVIALAIAAPSAHALEISACAVSPKPRVGALVSGPEQAAALQRMLAQLQTCQKDAVFLAALGQLLNSQERYLEAADHLEHALMLEPDLKDAQFSYAIALTGSGDVASARALIDNLLDDADLPEALRPLIERQKARLAMGAATLDATPWQKRFTFATRAGYDNNLLGSPNITSLPLTLAGQTLVLLLDGNYLARPAGYLRAEAQAEFARAPSEGVRLDALVAFRARYSPALAAAGSTQIDFLVERSAFTPSLPFGQTNGTPSSASPRTNGASSPHSTTDTSASGSYLNVTASALNANSGTRFVAAGLGGGWGFAWRGVDSRFCQARTGLELQERKYLDNEVLSSSYTGLSLNWSCENQNGAQLLLGFKAGRDRANDLNRPGGHQQQASVRFGAYLPRAVLPFGTSSVAAPSSTSGLRRGLSLDFEHSQQQDASTYSPIIDSGRSRNVSRTAIRIEYLYSFSGAVQGVVGAEWVGQTSNIQLFKLGSQGVYSGLRVGW
jgi:hypothetical protein